jgi:hypothetical protein
MRKTRERRRNGLRVISLEVRDAAIDELVSRRVLSADAREDRQAIAAALCALVDDVLNVKPSAPLSRDAIRELARL